MFDLDFSQVQWHAYSPGLLEQDLFTLPLEGGLVFAMNQDYTPAAHPAWPFRDEKADGPRQASRHPAGPLRWIGVGTASGVVALTKFARREAPLSVYVRGWIHNHLATEILVSLAKTGFQRKRPFYDTAAKEGTQRADDRLSFFSGHSAHSFAFMNYGRLLIKEMTEQPAVHWISGTAMMGVAAWIGSARAIDGQHYWSDVLTGAAVGTLVSTYMFHRVHDVAQTHYGPEKARTVDLVPLFSSDGEGRRWYGLRATVAL